MKVTRTEDPYFTQAESPGSWDFPGFRIQRKIMKR